MSLEQTKNIIADQLFAISEDISNLENIPSKKETLALINQLYEVMRQLSDFSEENGY